MEKHEQEQQYETAAQNSKRRISSLIKSISPPPRTRTRPATQPQPSLSALEAGQASTDNHLQTISAHLRKYAPKPPHAQTTTTPPHNTHPSTNPSPSPHHLKPPLPILPLDAWSTLYTSNAHPTGNHFVIHQHDHPIAGPHYDLRLQISASSSVSWAIMYGLPGDPNSKRANRNATETRVHCLWNHLIETASAKTGSMIIWDTGVYEVLPGRANKREPETETDTASESDMRSTHHSTSANASTPGANGNGPGGPNKPTESEKLRKAFQNHKINLRLHGTRLPKNYTIFLRRDKTDFRAPATPESISTTPKKKRRRRGAVEKKRVEPSTSDSDIDLDTGSGSGVRGSDTAPSTGKRKRGQDHGDEEVDGHEHEHEHAEHSDADADADGNNKAESDYLIRLHNAYPGAINDIGSVHQRRWFIGLDRVGCGFVRETQKDSSLGTARRRWVRGVDKRSGELTGFETFYVRGPEVERSVVTGRVGGDVLRDEGVEGFVPRRGWRAVTY